MKRTDDIIAIILIVMIIVLPLGWVILSNPAHPYYKTDGGSLEEAARSAGLEIIHTEDTLWLFPGALGGKIYVLRDDAGNTLSVQTQAFDSEKTRNAAIMTYNAQSVGKGRPVGTILVIGHEVIYIAPDQNGVLQKIAPEIKKMAGNR